MSVTPRSEIRAWIREQIDNGTPHADITRAAIQHVLDQPDIVAELVSEAVKAEANKVIGTVVRTHTPKQSDRDALRDAVEAEAKALPATSPFTPIAIPASRDIVLDLARMTKPEVLNLARELDGEASKAARYAGFVREIGTQLSGDERVQDRFTREDLLRMFAKSSIAVDARFFLGDRQVSRKELVG